MGAKLNTMYHIVKSKGQFMVVLVGRNGEALSTSERFTTKAKAWGNVAAQIDVTEHKSYFVQDDTVEKPMTYEIDGEGLKWKSSEPVQPKYTPGLNPKKKKV